MMVHTLWLESRNTQRIMYEKKMLVSILLKSIFTLFLKMLNRFSLRHIVIFLLLLHPSFHVTTYKEALWLCLQRVEQAIYLVREGGNKYLFGSDLIHMFKKLFPSFLGGKLILGEKNKRELNSRILHRISHSYLRIKFLFFTLFLWHDTFSCQSQNYQWYGEWD